tara:strand:+ start:528 stop:1739 length:1212 start_codon:yes stop_codon:yes gene_type:complete
VSKHNSESELYQGRNKLAWTVIIGHAIKHIYNSSLAIHLMPEMKLALTLNASQFGALASARQLTGGLMTMIAGYLGDRFSNRAASMLITSMILIGVSFFITGRVHNYWILFFVMMLMGIGPSLYHPPAISALSRKFPDRRGLLISLHGTGGSIGEVLGGSILIAVLITFFTWRDLMQLSILPVLIVSVFIWLMMRNLRFATDNFQVYSLKLYLSSLLSLLKNKSMLLLVLSTLMRSMGSSVLVTFLPIYLREDLELSANTVGIYMPLSQIIGIGSQPVMGYLSDRFGRKFVLIPGTALFGIFAVLLNLAEPGFQLIVCIIAIGAFWYPLHSIFIAAAIDVSKGKAQSTVVALIYGAGFMGTFSPVIVGLLIDLTNRTKDSFIVSGVLILIATALLFKINIKKN